MLLFTQKDKAGLRTGNVTVQIRSPRFIREGPIQENLETQKEME